MGRTAEELYEDGRKRLLSETGLRTLTKGAIARTLLQIYSEQVGAFYKYVDDTIINAYVSTAKGRFLDLIGDLVNVPRKGSSFANGKVRFYVSSEIDLTFNQILELLNNRDNGTRTTIPLPSGMTVRSGDKSYVTITDVEVASDGEVEVDVISSMAGRFSNVQQGGIDTIVWSDPVLSLLEGILLVTNDAPIESGRDMQSDDEYRYYIVNATTGAAKANETAIRLACLSVPGVSDINIEKYAFGIGTFGVYVISTSPITTDGTLAAVQEAIDFTQAEGTRGKAISPDLIGIQLKLALEFIPSTKTSEKTTITKQAQINAINYINNLHIGEELVIEELKQRVMDTSEKIHDLSIVSMVLGDYNTTTGAIDNADTTVSIANQTPGIREKFVSNKTLFEVCNI